MNISTNKSSKNAVLLAVILAEFQIPIMTSAVNIALPAIGKDFGLDIVILSWVGTIFLLASASLLLPFGRLADIYSRRKVFTLGVIGFLIGSILAAVATSGMMLLVARTIQGISASAIITTSTAILASAFPVGERGRALGISAAAIYLGLSLGPFLGGLLTQYAGWRSIFIFGSGLGLVGITTILKLKWGPSESKKERFDVAGSILFILALVLSMYGITVISSGTGIWLIIIGVASGLLFLWRESRTESPLINPSLFWRNRGFTLSNLAALISYSGTWSISFLLSLYLQYAKGLDPSRAGIILVANTVILMIFSPIFGRLSDRVEPRIIASAGMGFIALGLGLLIFLDAGTSIGYVLLCLVLVGFGTAMFASPNTNAIMSSVDQHLYGVASATLATMRQIGMISGLGIVMLLYSILIGRVEVTPENLPALIKSTQTAFLISTVLCTVAIFAVLARGNIYKNTTKNPPPN